jgi:hypothetical protein
MLQILGDVMTFKKYSQVSEMKNNLVEGMLLFCLFVHPDCHTVKRNVPMKGRLILMEDIKGALSVPFLHFTL